MSVTASFVWQCFSGSTIAPFHIPLIEPDRQISRIRFSDKTPRLCFRVQIYRYLFWHGSEEIAHWWRDTVRQIFAEENLAYVLDDVGGVHPAIDQEFQRNLVSTIAALQSERYQNIRQLAENASYHLRSEPPNYKQAWRATLSAVEGLFGLMFPYVRLTVDETSVVYCPRCRARTKETRRRREPHE